MSDKPSDVQRIAVVFIHGQGEQRPMEDVQELARTVWEGDPRWETDPKLKELLGGKPPRTWTVPDPTVGLADTGRVTTDAGRFHTRVDFLEFYWAHLMTGNRSDHVLKWMHALQKRPRSEAPDRLRVVRQGVLRAAESLTVIAMVFAALVAVMLPPPNAGDATERLFSNALARFGFNELAMTTLLSWAAIGLLLLSVVWIVWTDLLGGGSHPVKDKTLGQLKRGSHAKGVGAYWGIGGGLLVIGGVALAATSLGPTLEWADLRFAILPLIIISALLAIRRLVATALTVALVTALVAVLGAVFGQLSVDHTVSVLTPFSGELATSNWLVGASWLDAAVQPLIGGFAPDWLAPRTGILVHVLFFLQFLAGCWFLAGLNSETGASKHVAVRLVLILLWLLLAAAATLLILWTGWVENPEKALLFWLGFLLALLVLGAGLMFKAANRAFLVPVMADSARYFGREPESIAARERIRKAGIDLMDQLHGVGEGAREYDRIIVVAHSLGSVVGYELITDYWARHSGCYQIDGDAGLASAVAAVDAAAADLSGPEGSFDTRVKRYQDAQTYLWHALKGAKVQTEDNARVCAPSWKISDFVTLGSPLTYASLLMAASREDFRAKQADRKLSTCPPALVELEGDRAEGAPASIERLTYSPGPGRAKFAHSACFGPVRWTNLFFRTNPFLLAGDLIGGPLSNARNRDGLGTGINDRALDHFSTGKMFAHMEYWRSKVTKPRKNHDLREDTPAHVLELINALRLTDTM